MIPYYSLTCIHCGTPRGEGRGQRRNNDNGTSGVSGLGRIMVSEGLSPCAMMREVSVGQNDIRVACALGGWTASLGG
jgi:hypothetical protein